MLMLNITATTMAKTMFNFNGKAYAAMAVTAATVAVKNRILVLANEQKIPTKQSVPAKPKPQAGGMMLAKKIPKKLATIQLSQTMQVLPAKNAD